MATKSTNEAAGSEQVFRLRTGHEIRIVTPRDAEPLNFTPGMIRILENAWGALKDHPAEPLVDAEIEKARQQEREEAAAAAVTELDGSAR